MGCVGAIYLDRVSGSKEGEMAKQSDKRTSPKVASKASEILRNPKSTKTEKSVAASDLAQAAGNKKNKK